MDEKYEKLKNVSGNTLLKSGIVIYICGFIFLYFVGQNYTGFWSFFAPFSIVLGVILISVGLIK